jgi:transcriptional regulator with XRE-family HTH domain
MENADFIERLGRTFDGATMAVVARRLGIPHATVRNYYKEGRLPAPEVLMKIAAETGVSLNWLLLGQGEMFVSDTAPLELGRFLEFKIGEMIDRKLAAINMLCDSGMNSSPSEHMIAPMIKYGVRLPHLEFVRSLIAPMIGCTTNPVIGPASCRIGKEASSAPR